MPMPSALEIARQATLKPVAEIAEDIGIPPWLIEPYGEFVAKIGLGAIEALAGRPRARYVVVTAVTPTPLGEGKTTTTIGLGQAMRHIGKRATISIRQASMGPTFGIKGGAAGGGYSKAVPFESLNLHLTGDMHAVTAAHNQLAAMVDNHLHMGNALDIDQHTISWRRVLDVNDRALRNIVIGLGTAADGVPRQTGFDITAASEVMAVLALASSLQDMRARLGRIVVGYTPSGEPVTAEQLKAAGAMTVIMRDAIKPNLLQTLENTPVLVHAGPFGNIAHGNSSVVADLIGIHSGEFLITEAGFGADMGAERFFNIKCRVSGLTPDAAVVVTTVRALKAHSGRHRLVAGRPLPAAMLQENPEEVLLGAANLRKQLENVRAHGVSPVVAINAMPGDLRRSSPSSARSRTRWESGRRSAPTPPTGAAVPPSWPRPWPRPPRSPVSSVSSTRPRHRCGRRSRRSPADCTVPTASTTRPRPPGSSMPSNAVGSAACRSAWPRPSCRCPRTRGSRGPRPAGGYRSGRRARRSEPDSFMPSAGRCARCQGWPQIPPPSGSISTPTVR